MQQVTYMHHIRFAKAYIHHWASNFCAALASFNAKSCWVFIDLRSMSFLVFMSRRDSSRSALMEAS